MALTLLFVLAYLQILPSPASPAAPHPAPQLTVSPVHPVYITGEVVTLKCSAVGASTVSGIRFFQDSQEICSKEGISPPDSYINSLQLSPVSRWHAGVYSCQYWKDVSGEEIPSESSQPISIAVTASPSAPTLTMTPQRQIFIIGESVTLTCSVPRKSTLTKIWFFRDSQKIPFKELPRSPSNYSVSLQLRGESGSHSRAYSCEYWTNVSRREIASQRSQPISIEVTACPSAPKLTLSPQHEIFIPGESVTLTCSAPSTSTLSGFQFFRHNGTIKSRQFPRSAASYSVSLQLQVVSGSYSRVYSCEYWMNVSGREIPSQGSQRISIAVTDPPPQPELSVDPPSGTVQKGLSLNITCTAPGGAGEQRFHFYKDRVEISSGHLGSKISSTDPGISSVKTSVLSILQAGPNNIGEYTCRYKKNVSGRWVLSVGSQAVNITVSIINTAHSYLWVRVLAVGGSFFLVNGLIFLVTHCCL